MVSSGPWSPRKARCVKWGAWLDGADHCRRGDRGVDWGGARPVDDGGGGAGEPCVRRGGAHAGRPDRGRHEEAQVDAGSGAVGCTAHDATDAGRQVCGLCDRRERWVHPGHVPAAFLGQPASHPQAWPRVDTQT
jgi:hypothetical protein